MRFLLISMLGGLMSCRPALQPRQPAAVDVACINKFKPHFTSDLYDASVDVIGKHISGLVLFKMMPDSAMRIVFTNEAGIKFFDFGFQGDGKFSAHYVIKQLNRKLVVKTLRKDFELTMMSRVGKEQPEAYFVKDELRFSFAGKKETDWVVTDAGCSTLLRLEQGTEEKKKTNVRLFGKPGHVPDSIFINHLNFNMVIKLKRLDRL